MDLKRELDVFIAIAEEGQMAAAARRLHMSTSALSRHLKTLEDWSGCTLFLRTTRSVSLTATGEAQLQRARSILALTREFQDAGLDTPDTPLTGILRITAPDFVFRRILRDVVAAFAEENSAIHLDLIGTDRRVDLIREGFDAALRVGSLDDSTMKARKLLSIGTKLVASPRYLERHGTPQVAADLKSHSCIIDTAPGYFDHWPVRDASARRGVGVSGQLVVNGGEFAAELARIGLGVAFLPETLVDDDLKAGRLVSLLDRASKPQSDLHLVFPASRYPSPRLSAFVEACARHVRP